MCPLGYSANEPSLLKLSVSLNHLKNTNLTLQHPSESSHELSVDIFPLSHLTDLCALFQQTPCFQLDSANWEHRWTGEREGSGVRLALLQLPPCILTSPSSREDWSSCQGGSSTRHSLSPESGGFSCLGAVMLPSPGVGTAFVVP